ncbi:hypothetical protein BHE74_00050990 [Ensete ventricosum]|nr:hypothetical protein BHE74_00050990 [Ensete ventricosum]
MKVTIKSSTEPLLPSSASYACNQSLVGDKLRSFRSCLRWMCINQSDARHAMVLFDTPIAWAFSSPPPPNSSSLTPPPFMPTMWSSPEVCREFADRLSRARQEFAGRMPGVRRKEIGSSPRVRRKDAGSSPKD